jgi:SAM-dependent methyltransferase
MGETGDGIIDREPLTSAPVTRERTELVLASFLMLFTELVLIRWAGAYVIYLSYFANFILLGSFLGIGIGFLRADRGPDLFRWAPVILAVFLGLVKALPVTIDRTGSDLVYFGVQQHGLPSWVMLPSLFAATALTMAAIAHGVAVRFRRFSALDAYRLDIVGAIAGIVTFSALAMLGFGPLSWAIVIALLFLFLLWRPTLLHGVAIAGIVVILAIGAFASGTVWSPYYRLEVSHVNGFTLITANGVPHQASRSTVGTDYEVPYERLSRPPKDVLVIGAGNGNDVAVALREGAQHVDAVEIDPRIQELGVEFHPEHPYQDPRVTRIIADGRAFLERTDSKYDLIIFALPDSLTLVAGQSALRLESYLFTKQAFESARDHLAPGGAFAMYNYYREQWLADRLAGTMDAVFGGPPCLDFGEPGVGQKSIFVDAVDRSALDCGSVWNAGGREVVSPAVDDRPFVYLRTRSIPTRYLVTLALILFASLIAVRSAGGPYRPMGRYLDLFFMGAAFLLLETKSVVQFALLFGTTWFVNALVFAGVLLFVLAAIEVERRVRIGRRGLLYGLLFGALAVAWLVPTDALLQFAVVPRFFLAVTLAFVPIFLANLIFAERFRDAADTTAAFGANLLGAMVGGLLEYLSLLTGYRALLLLVAVLYALAFLMTSRLTRGAQVSVGEKVLAPQAG